LLIEELDPPELAETPQAWQQVWLAGEVFLELGVPRAKDTSHGKRLLKRTRSHLRQLVEEAHLSPEERLKAGDVLGQLGDPRPGVGVIREGEWEIPQVDWIEIPSGSFTMGSEEEDEDAWDDEKPAHELHLNSYFIARYPLTNDQYRPFWEQGGYDDPDYWSEEGWAWRQGAQADLSPIDDKDFRKTYENWLANRPQEKRDRPYWWDDPRWGGANRPVVGVSWYEALAYCAWLNEQLTERVEEILNHVEIKERGFWEQIANGRCVVRLPTEAEWEKAARGEESVRWPWGNEWVGGYANTEETNLEETSPVGIFPGGASPYGLLDMVGNVWEWTTSRWGRESFGNPDYGYPYRPDDGREVLSGPDLRVVRGGSWFNSRRFARCASRFGDFPDGFFLYGSGFRVVVSLARSDS
jgi:formylglycine-generating enzyme required for sulfatase activity